MAAVTATLSERKLALIGITTRASAASATRLGNARGFPSEQQDVRCLIAEIKIWRGALGGEQKQAVTGGPAPFLELGPGIVAPPVELVEVVHPGASEIAVRYRKTRRLDDVRRHAHAGAKPEDGAGVLWNVGLVKRDLHLILLAASGQARCHSHFTRGPAAGICEKTPCCAELVHCTQASR